MAWVINTVKLSFNIQTLNIRINTTHLFAKLFHCQNLVDILNAFHAKNLFIALDTGAFLMELGNLL